MLSNEAIQRVLAGEDPVVADLPRQEVKPRADSGELIIETPPIQTLSRPVEETKEKTNPYPDDEPPPPSETPVDTTTATTPPPPSTEVIPAAEAPAISPEVVSVDPIPADPSPADSSPADTPSHSTPITN